MIRLVKSNLFNWFFADEGGWWHGRLKGRTGLFPSNYVEKI
jgi:hypothetical protein